MIYQNVLLSVKNTADIDRVLGLLREHARMSRAEPGCERFEVYQSEAEPTQIFLIERWLDESAMAEHRAAEAMQTIYLPQVIPLVERSPHPSRCIFPHQD